MLLENIERDLTVPSIFVLIYLNHLAYSMRKECIFLWQEKLRLSIQFSVPFLPQMSVLLRIEL